MKMKNILSSKALCAGMIITACVMPALRAVPPVSSIDAYFRRTDASVYTTTSSPVYLPSQWSIANNGRLRGFIKATNGLNVAASASVFLDLFEPLAGELRLGNGSTLNLESDLFLTSSAYLRVGTTTGHTATLKSAQAATIHLGNDLSIPAGRTLFVDSPELTIDGGGFTCSFASSAAALRINSGKTLTLRNMVINGLTGADQIKGPGTLKLQNCVVNLPTSDVTWSASWGNVRILVADDVVIRGGGTFVFGSATSLTVSANSMLSFDNNTTFSFAPQDKSRTRLYFGDSSSILRLNGSTFCAPGRGGGTGVALTKGTLILDNKVTFSNSHNYNTAKAFTFGSGTGSADLAVRLNAGASINLDCGIIDYKNVDA
jgi:hypothetical protein